MADANFAVSRIGRIAWPGWLGTAGRPDARRSLQLALAGIWLLDGVLQFQSFMYTQAFPRTLAAAASGNPGVIARPVTWDAALIAHHLVLLNTVFALTQVLLGIGIVFRPTVQAALAASVAWSLAVWWLGEGLGGVLSGTASPVSGAPGAVLLYALLAVLLWPVSPGRPASFAAARAVGVPVARGLWLALWLALEWFALTPANRAPQAMAQIIAGMANSEPRWLAGLDRAAASFVAGHGLAASITLGVALVIIAGGIWLPQSAARAVLVLAIAVAAVIWIVGEGLGGIFTGSGTDPNSGPLLALLALAYWPARTAPATAGP